MPIRVFVFGVIIAMGLSGAAAAAPAESRAMLERDVENWKKDPIYGETAATLEQLFPDDWAKLKQHVVDLAASGADEPTLEAGALKDIKALVANHLVDVASAPTPELMAVAKASSDFETHLRLESPALCAKYAISGLSGTETLSPKSSELLGHSGVFVLRAAAAGALHPTARGQVTHEDVEQLEAAMKNHGASQVAVDAMLSGKLGGLPVDAQCDLGVALYASFNDMPSEAGARVFSAVLTAIASAANKRP
jgi:hypothetical protein